MPELAEVEYFRKIWNPGLKQKVLQVQLHPKAAVFRNSDPREIEIKLTGKSLQSSAAAAKQMLFSFSGNCWLGIHLGMTGELKVQEASYAPKKHDHLVLYQGKQALVFSDFRTFGSVQFSVGKDAPEWWTKIAPAILSSEFTVQAVKIFLQRRARAPVKAVLLMQERFPGVGNWMADEILWRAGIHPAKPAGKLSDKEASSLRQESQWVCRQALRIIGEKWGDLPDSWLFNHRWRKGGTCPKTGTKLKHSTIGGRTTCWSPGRQKL